MHDAITTLADIKKTVEDMVVEREWHQFHTLKNLAMNISSESAELMEHFLWCTTEQSKEVLLQKRQHVEDELADVLIALVAFANAADISIAAAFEKKIEQVKDKYPVSLARGRSDKYTLYQEAKEKAKKKS